MALTYAVESLAKCWNEFIVLSLQHWEETESFRRGEQFAPSYKRYIQCEQTGYFVMFTARDGEKLAGYAGMYVTTSMHSQAMIASEDYWFLLPEYRKGRNALSMVKYVEAELAGRGVTAITMSAKISNGAGKILEYLGYLPVSTQCFKTLTAPNLAKLAKQPDLAYGATLGRADSAAVSLTAVMGEHPDVQTIPTAPA